MKHHQIIDRSRNNSKDLFCSLFCVNLGAVDTEISRHSTVMWLMLKLGALFVKTPKSGAQTIIAVAVDPEWEQVSGQWFADCQVANVGKNAKDDETAEWLWEKSVTLTDLNESV